MDMEKLKPKLSELVDHMSRGALTFLRFDQIYMCMV
jgi:hypothetical protein